MGQGESLHSLQAACCLRSQGREAIVPYLTLPLLTKKDLDGAPMMVGGPVGQGIGGRLRAACEIWHEALFVATANAKQQDFR